MFHGGQLRGHLTDGCYGRGSDEYASKTIKRRIFRVTLRCKRFCLSTEEVPTGGYIHPANMLLAIQGSRVQRDYIRLLVVVTSAKY
jgi:hypothetical protein